MRSAVIEIRKEELKFSAGHFMLTSPSTRESLHGHDYQVQVTFTTVIQDNGMAFDLRLYKEKLQQLCKQLDYRFIVPTQSPYLTLIEHTDEWEIQFAGKKQIFLKQDISLLPITNATLEEISYWFIQQMVCNPATLQNEGITKIRVRVFNGRGEAGGSTWESS